MLRPTIIGERVLFVSHDGRPYIGRFAGKSEEFYLVVEDPSESVRPIPGHKIVSLDRCSIQDIFLQVTPDGNRLVGRPDTPDVALTIEQLLNGCDIVGQWYRNGTSAIQVISLSEVSLSQEDEKYRKIRIDATVSPKELVIYCYRGYDGSLTYRRV